MPDFNPERDIPDLSGKVCLVTGGNSGLGEATIAALACHKPAKVYLAARSHSKAEAAVSRIKKAYPAAAATNIEILDLDLASFESIVSAAAKVNNEVDRLDILQLNGGVGMVPHETTKDGYEIHFGTNYLGHAFLTQLLMPKLLATSKMPGADVRIILMSSVGHRVFAPDTGIQFEHLKTDMNGYAGRTNYGHAMLAKTLFADQLAKKYPSITSSSLHPGTVKSNTWQGDKSVNWFLNKLVIQPLVALTGVSNEEGAKTQLWCSFSKDVKNGSYYEPVGKGGKENKLLHNGEMSKKLWDWSEKEFQAHNPSGWPAN